MEFLIQTIQVVSAILLIFLILIQRSDASVGGAFGGGDVSETAGLKRRGSQKVVFIITIIMALVFAGSIIYPILL